MCGLLCVWFCEMCLWDDCLRVNLCCCVWWGLRFIGWVCVCCCREIVCLRCVCCR